MGNAGEHNGLCIPYVLEMESVETSSYIHTHTHMYTCEWVQDTAPLSEQCIKGSKEKAHSFQTPKRSSDGAEEESAEKQEQKQEPEKMGGGVHTRLLAATVVTGAIVNNMLLLAVHFVDQHHELMGRINCFQVSQLV